MASNTKQTEFRRKNRHKEMGAKRKAALRSKGSTQVFPIHTPEIDAAAPAAQVSPAKSEG